MSTDEIDAAWQRGAFRDAYALSAVEVARLAELDQPYRAGREPLEEARIWHRHGRMCWHVARFTEADHALHTAYTTRRELLGEDDDDTLDSLERLAAVADYQTKSTLAVTRFTEVITRLERTHGDASVRVAIARRNLAACHRSSGAIGRAESVLALALEVLERELPPAHPDHVDALKGLAMLSRLRGANWKALDVADQAIKLGRECWDIDHPFVAAAELTAAHVETALHKYRAAHRRLARIVPCFEQSYGDHPLLAIALNASAANNLASGDRPEATEQIARRAHTMYCAFYPPNSTATTLIEVLIWRNKLDDAAAVAVELEATAKPIELHKIALVVAGAFVRSGPPPRAREWIEKVRATAPEEGRAAVEEGLRAWTERLAAMPEKS